MAKRKGKKQRSLESITLMERLIRVRHRRFMEDLHFWRSGVTTWRTQVPNDIDENAGK